MKTTFCKFFAAAMALVMSAALCACNAKPDDDSTDGILLGESGTDAATVFLNENFEIVFDLELSTHPKDSDPIQWSKPSAVDGTDDLAKVSGTFYYKNMINANAPHTEVTVYASRLMNMADFLTYYAEQKGVTPEKLDDAGKIYYLPEEKSIVFLRVKKNEHDKKDTDYFVFVKDIVHTEEVLEYFNLGNLFTDSVRGFVSEMTGNQN